MGSNTTVYIHKIEKRLYRLIRHSTMNDIAHLEALPMPNDEEGYALKLVGLTCKEFAKYYAPATPAERILYGRTDAV